MKDKIIKIKVSKRLSVNPSQKLLEPHQMVKPTGPSVFSPEKDKLIRKAVQMARAKSNNKFSFRNIPKVNCSPIRKVIFLKDTPFQKKVKQKAARSLLLRNRILNKQISQQNLALSSQKTRNETPTQRLGIITTMTAIKGDRTNFKTIDSEMETILKKTQASSPKFRAIRTKRLNTQKMNRETSYKVLTSVKDRFKTLY